MSTDSSDNRSYYCSLKFKALKIDLESKTTLNCHASTSYPVDFKWLSDNPGQLFNNARSVAERRMMLLNQRNSSCEQNCWPAEDRGAISPRMYYNGTERTHTQIITQPETIDLAIGSDCNLTCSYCCKEYSSAWRRDVINNGDYIDTGEADRYKLTAKDQVLEKLSQQELKNSKNYSILLDEIKFAAPGLKKLIITGGEPLLDNHLLQTITELKLSPAAEVQIYTGLGVSSSRFIKSVEKLKSISNLTLYVSAESTGKNLEFNRYGNRWVDILEKLDILKNSGIKVCLHATLSNLTLMGFVDFYKYFSDDYQIVVSFAHTPIMTAVHVLDADTKNQIKNDLASLPESVTGQILASMKSEPTPDQKNHLKNFLTQFTSRRPDLSMNIFPESFVKWIGLEHVV